MKWISCKKKMPEPTHVFDKEAKKVIILRDYSQWGAGKKRIDIATVHETNEGEEISFGGPNSLTGSGFLTGIYFAVPSICNPDSVTHWMELPLLPKK